MSELFRIRQTPAVATASAGQLAHLIHQAEDTGDDVLLLQATDEVTRRDIWPVVMVFYREEMTARRRS